MLNFNTYQDFLNALQTNIPSAVEQTDEQRLTTLALGLASEAGEVTDHIYKYMRDGKLDRPALTKELGDLLAMLTLVASQLELPLEYVVATNVIKLNDRQARNTLQGSGDNR